MWRWAEHPGVLTAATLAAVDDELALRQCDPGQSSGEHPDVFAIVDSEWSKIDMARLQTVFDQGWHCGQLYDRLRDPATRVLSYPAPQCIQLRFGGARADHNALATRAIHRLNHQFFETIQHLLARLIILKAPGINIGQDRFFPQVV